MLKAKLKRCNLDDWRNKGNTNLDIIYDKYGITEWFDITYDGYCAYYPTELPRSSNFIKEDLIIKEFE